MAHKTKCSPEEKVLLIEKHLSGEISAMRAAEIAGVHKSSFGTWIRIYKQEGPLGLKNTGRNRYYSPEVKMQAVLAYLSGEGSLRVVSARFKIRIAKECSQIIHVVYLPPLKYMFMQISSIL